MVYWKPRHEKMKWSKICNVCLAFISNFVLASGFFIAANGKNNALFMSKQNPLLFPMTGAFYLTHRNRGVQRGGFWRRNCTCSYRPSCCTWPYRQPKFLTAPSYFEDPRPEFGEMFFFMLIIHFSLFDGLWSKFTIPASLQFVNVLRR